MTRPTKPPPPRVPKPVKAWAVVYRGRIRSIYLDSEIHPEAWDGLIRGTFTPDALRKPKGRRRKE